MKTGHIVSLLAIVFIIQKSSCYECDANANVCETSLVVEHQLTMIHSTEKAVYPKGGKLYRYDVTNVTGITDIPVAEVITADGWEGSRLLVVANGSMPGPPIIVYEGQTVIVHVTNHLKSEQVSIHWHGLAQTGTPYMDGVPFLSQCPISTGQTFVYKFQASHKGTYWYHSHVGSQRSKGLFGAFIIRERKPLGMTEHIMTIQEWNHDWDSDMEDAKMNFGAYENRQKFQSSQSLDGQHFSLLKAQSGLINGRGRYLDLNTGTHNEAPLEVYQVQQGQQYRFRVIAAGALYPWSISIDNHNLTIIASDGFDIEPQTADSFIINAGERYDFVITADKPIANYWIRAKTLESNRNTTTEAILRYKGATETDPSTNPRICTAENRCLVVNCFFLYYPENTFTDCLRIDQLKHKENNDPAPAVVRGKFEEYFLNFAFPGTTFTPSSVNGRKFMLPTTFPISGPADINIPCDQANCGEQKVCTCTNSLSLNYGDTVQIVFLNMGSGKGWAHPVHMHGHTFYVLKMGYASYDNTTGKMLSENPDVNCRGGTTRDKSFCNNATWSNSSWANGNIPGLELQKPVRKDTIIVPSGGYIVTRIVADNPGVWFMHCHIELHANDGMAIYLNESFPKLPPPPQGFPSCHNFRNDGYRAPPPPIVGEQTESDFYTERNFWIVVGVLCGVIFVQLVVIVCCCCCRKMSKDSETSYNLSGKQNPGFT